jgi:hypothetical protein
VTLEERIVALRARCDEALKGPLQGGVTFLRDRGLDDPTIVRSLAAVADTQQVPDNLKGLAQESASVSTSGEAAVLERAMLLTAAVAMIPAIPSLPVDASVKHLLCKEILSYAQPPAGSLDRFAIGGWPFIAMSKIVTGRRFTAGQSHWEVSGLGRRYLARAPWNQWPGTLWFIVAKMRRLHPYFVCHLGGTTVRLPLLSQREFLKAFCRLAMAMELQPHIKGVLAGSWLHSTETHRVSPHLAFLNQPYLECGGHYFDAGPAAESDGFLTGDAHRSELYRSGQYKPTFGVVLCSREQMLHWLRRHPEIAANLDVR